MVNMSANSLQVVIGLTNDTEAVINNTPGTTLIPGTNLFGTVDVSEWRQKFRHPALSAFGPLFNVIIIGFYYYSKLLTIISSSVLHNFQCGANTQRNYRSFGTNVPFHPSCS